MLMLHSPLLRASVWQTLKIFLSLLLYNQQHLSHVNPFSSTIQSILCYFVLLIVMIWNDNTPRGTYIWILFTLFGFLLVVFVFWHKTLVHATSKQWKQKCLHILNLYTTHFLWQFRISSHKEQFFWEIQQLLEEICEGNWSKFFLRLRFVKPRMWHVF